MEELNRRHASAMRVIWSVFLLTVVLMILAATDTIRIPIKRNPVIEGALRISLALFGVGAIVLRRTKFATLRLKDIGGVGGGSALLETLEKTTIQVAILAAVIAVMGFVLSLFEVSDNDRWLGIVAIAVLLYAYPRRASWLRVLDMTRQERVDEAPTAKGTIA